MTDQEALTQALKLLASPKQRDRMDGFTQRKYLVMRLGGKAVEDMTNAIRGKESQGRNTYRPKAGA